MKLTKLTAMFVDDIKNFWKWLTTWVLAGATAIGTAWEVWPQFQSFVMENAPVDVKAHMGAILMIFGVVAFVARVIKQTKGVDPAVPK
jgi:hypothetical protein